MPDKCPMPDKCMASEGTGLCLTNLPSDASPVACRQIQHPGGHVAARGLDINSAELVIIQRPLTPT
jgi:hypothetical protein